MRPSQFGRRATDNRGAGVATFGQSAGSQVRGRDTGDTIEELLGGRSAAGGEPFVSDATRVDQAVEVVGPFVSDVLGPDKIRSLSRGDLAKELESIALRVCEERSIELNTSEIRDVVTVLLNDAISAAHKMIQTASAPQNRHGTDSDRFHRESFSANVIEGMTGALSS